MKKITLSLITLASAASLAQASLVLSNAFAYPDGSLTSGSAGSPLGEWSAHSGAGAQAVQVGGEAITLVTSSGSAEDVSTVLTNAAFPVAFTTETLYVSFKVKFQTLPTTGTSTYFAHFRDNGTTFRARVFSTTSGAGSGKFRVGITSSSSSAYVPVTTDLDLDTEYKLVIRFAGSTNATLWINPTSEASVANRADATDATTLGAYYSLFYSFRQSAGMGTLTVDDLLIGTTFADVQTIGGPPSISGLVDVHMPWNSNTGDRPFVVSDVETPPNDLIVTAASDNPTLVPNTPSNLALGGSAGNRVLKVTPATGQQGTASIEVVVRDGNNETATNSFKVYVGEPTISVLADQTTATNTVLGPLAFTVGDVESPAGSLTVTPSSSNEGLIPTANIAIANLGGQNRTVTITPAPDTAGIATITLTVGDGTWSIPTSFTVTVYPKLGLLMKEPFDYADGPIGGNGGWGWHSGTNGDCQVINNKLSLSYALSEDISTNLPGFYIDANSGTILYSSVKVNFSALPGSGTEYFMHYRDSGTSNYRARVSATTSGAAPGKFRIAIANSASTAVTVPRDLSTNTTYLVVARYNVSTGISTVWVNPDSDASGGMTATVGASPLNLYYLSFRQNSGIGMLTLDDLKVGTQWSDVWEAMAPEPEALRAQQLGDRLVLSWTNPAFSLQAAPTLTDTFVNVDGATSPYTNTLSGEKFFRLRY